MVERIKVCDIELSSPIITLDGLDGYQLLQGIVRLHGVPIAYVKVPVTGGRCSARALVNAILEQHAWPILRHFLQDRLTQPLVAPELPIRDLLASAHPAHSAELPVVTVVVCTRDRTEHLELCLESLSRLDYPALDIVIVDNAPTTDATERLVKTKYPRMRYACEPRPGLDWARNRGILEARGEIVAYTDDDVVVDAGWVRALASVFAEDPDVMAVTGLTVPYEQETEAQLLLELYGGFGRGFERRWYRIDVESGEEAGFSYGGAGRYGAGANMSFRRSVFEKIGYFDPALDVGTVTNGGGDLEMFFRVLKEGFTLVYEPSALVRHRHRREYQQLWKQIHNNGIGLYSFFERCAQAYPDTRAGFRKLGWYWLRWWNIRRYLIALFRPTLFPRDLIWAELKGSVIGLREHRYQKARAKAAEIEAQFGPQTAASVPKRQPPREIAPLEHRIAMRSLDLTQPLTALDDVREFAAVRIMVTTGHQLVGLVEILNKHQPVSVTRLRDAIVDQLNLHLLRIGTKESPDARWSEAVSLLRQKFAPAEAAASEPPDDRLPDQVGVSVVVATYDRPDDLIECLRCVTAQKTHRPVEIIVVDNHPASGLTPPALAQFPGVTLLAEYRKGATFARNTGITAARHGIIITTDDDIVLPPDWLENLVAPFAREDVMMVTGNFLPPELDTPAQHKFARYDNMGRGHLRREVSGQWFESFRRRAVPTWELGGTGNAAYRASLFREPRIGLMAEMLGAGVPTGTGEDIYFFYKVLKAGHTIVYEPSAFVWHKYRRDMAAFERQVYNYSKGHVAYHLITAVVDRDFRGLVQIGIVLPRWRMRQVWERLRGKRDYSLRLIWIEAKGNLAGPWSLWQAIRHVKRENRAHAHRVKESDAAPSYKSAQTAE